MTVEFDFYLKMSPASQTLKFGSHTDTKQSIYLSDVILRYPMSVNLEAVFRIRFSKFGLGLYMNSLEIFSEYSNPSFSSLFKSVRAVWRTTLYV